MDKELIETHIKLKDTHGFTDKKYDTFFDGRVLQICFYSTGCKCSKNGSCIMCDYGPIRENNLSKEDIKEIMNEVFDKLTEMPSVLLLNCLGSVLDPQEMPMENLVTLLEEVSKLDIKTIIFETHYSTITTSILDLVKTKLNDKDIAIELGLESADREVREKCLNKYIDNAKLIEKIQLVKSFGFDTEANLMFGIPFLTREEQIKDTLESIKWCMENGFSKVDLFPVNIKPYTLLYKLYEGGKYSPVTHNNFIEVLEKIPKEDIGRIHLCWYGNRELNYGEKKTILPTCENDKYDKIIKFYEEFNMNKDAKNRIELLENIASEIDLHSTRREELEKLIQEVLAKKNELNRVTQLDKEYKDNSKEM